MEYEVTNNNLTYIDYNKHNTHLLIMCSTHHGKHHYMALNTITELSQKYHFDFIILYSIITLMIIMKDHMIKS